MRRWSAMLALALGVGCGTTMPTPGAIRKTFHVAPGGSDEAAGSPEEPWGTVEHAAAVAKGGERVVLHAGEYREGTAIVVKNSGGPEGWIELVAAKDEQPILDGAIEIDGVSFVLVEGLTFRGRGAGIAVRDSHHVSLRGNLIDSPGALGIDVRDSDGDGKGTSQIEVLHNTITRADGSPDGAALTIAGVQTFEVAGNVVHHCAKAGIAIVKGAKQGKVHHDEVHDNEGGGVVIAAAAEVALQGSVIHDNGGRGIEVAPGSAKIDILRNTVHANRGGGVYLSDHLEDIDVGDNIVSDNTPFPIGLVLEPGLSESAVAAAHNIAIARNLVYPPPSRAGEATHVHATAGTDAVTQPPGFVDAAKSNFKLRPDSPAQGRGAY